MYRDDISKTFFYHVFGSAGYNNCIMTGQQLPVCVLTK